MPDGTRKAGRGWGNDHHLHKYVQAELPRYNGGRGRENREGSTFLSTGTPETCCPATNGGHSRQEGEGPRGGLRQQRATGSGSAAEQLAHVLDFRRRRLAHRDPATSDAHELERRQAESERPLAKVRETRLWPHAPSPLRVRVLVAHPSAVAAAKAVKSDPRLMVASLRDAADSTCVANLRNVPRRPVCCSQRPLHTQPL